MQDDDLIAAFWETRADKGGSNAARFHDTHTPFDQELLASLVRAGSRVLDLGCGTCVIANWLVAELGVRVHAVDFQPSFLAHAIDHERLTTECADVRGFDASSGGYDLVLLLGVVQHILSVPERRALYARIADVLGAHGTLVVKSQFGTNQDVIVRGHSDDLGVYHVSTYPHLQREVALLSERFDVQVKSIYPPELSPHTNTRFYHLLCVGQLL